MDGTSAGRPVIAAITIGQSPRVDITPEFRSALGGAAELTETGALDDLSPEQIAALAPGPADELLVSRLRDGREVHLAEHHVVELVQSRIDELRRANAPGPAAAASGNATAPAHARPDLIVLLCTGSFPTLHSPVPLLFPDRILRGVAEAVCDKGRIACIAPSADQRRLTEEKWEGVAGEIIFGAVSPYSASPEEARAVVEQVAAAEPELIVLDCLGFDRAMKRLVRSVSRAPVLLPRTITARVAAELVEGGSQ